MSTKKRRGPERVPALALPHRPRGWKTGPNGLFGLRLHRSKRSDGTEVRAYSFTVPRTLGDRLVEMGFIDQQYTVEVVEEGILYRRVQ